MSLSGMFPEQRISPNQMDGETSERSMPEFNESKEPAVDVLIENLVSLCSYLDKLYMQSHLIHLNIEGPLFFPLHKFLKNSIHS
jgi:DNA-binding ferritin-like protein